MFECLGYILLSAGCIFQQAMAFNKLAKKLHKRETMCANMDEIGMVKLKVRHVWDVARLVLCCTWHVLWLCCLPIDAQSVLLNNSQPDISSLPEHDDNGDKEIDVEGFSSTEHYTPGQPPPHHSMPSCHGIYGDSQWWLQISHHQMLLFEFSGDRELTHDLSETARAEEIQQRRSPMTARYDTLFDSYLAL